MITLLENEIEVLICVMGRQYTQHDPRDSISITTISNDLYDAGFKPIAVPMAINKLIGKKMINEVHDEIFGNNFLLGYSITDMGKNWMYENAEKIKFKQQNSHEQKEPSIKNKDETYNFAEAYATRCV
jgi:hypothetical protein